MSPLDKLINAGPITKAAASMLGSEAAAVGIGPYGPIAMKKIAPGLRTKLISSVSNHIVLPNIDSFQDSMEDMFHAKEDQQKWQAAKKGGLQARADFMAEHATDIALTFPASFGTAMLAKKAIDCMIGGEVTTKHFVFGSLLEGGIHLGLMGALPKMLPHQMGAFKSAMSKTLQNVGVSKESADKYATNFTYSGIADAAGFAANFAYQILMLRGKSRG